MQIPVGFASRASFITSRMLIVASRGLFAAALACWAVAALLLSGLAPATAVRVDAALLAYATAAFFALVALTRAAVARAGGSGAFWALLAGGLLLRLAGDLGWADPGTFGGVRGPLTAYDAAYFASDLASFAALVWLAARVVGRATPVAAMDALAVSLSVGTLVFYFVVGPAAGGAGDLGDPLPALGTLSGAVCDAAFLALILLAGFAERRPPFVPFLAPAFACFLAAEVVYVARRSSGAYQIGGWPELVWAAGFVCLGLVALRSAAPAPAGSSPLPEIGPLGVFSFWLGPLSPAVHYGLLLAWGAARPPLPPYVLLGAAAVLGYAALRTALVSRLAKGLRLEREATAVREEQARISEDMHDTLKQSVHSVPLLLEAFREAREEDERHAEEILDRAAESSREASYRISRPIGELRARCERSALDPLVLMSQVLRDVGSCFAVGIEEDMRACLDELTPEELAAAYRIASEALWNAAKHARARTVRLESRRVGSVLLVKVRDDGRGFSTEEPPTGLGLSLMSARAEEVGAGIDVISSPGRGTTVQVRFDKG